MEKNVFFDAIVEKCSEIPDEELRSEAEEIIVNIIDNNIKKRGFFPAVIVLSAATKILIESRGNENDRDWE